MTRFFLIREESCKNIVVFTRTGRMAEIFDACGRGEWERAELLFDENVSEAREYKVCSDVSWNFNLQLWTNKPIFIRIGNLGQFFTKQ